MAHGCHAADPGPVFGVSFLGFHRLVIGCRHLAVQACSPAPRSTRAGSHGRGARLPDRQQADRAAQRKASMETSRLGAINSKAGRRLAGGCCPSLQGLMGTIRVHWGGGGGDGCSCGASGVSRWRRPANEPASGRLHELPRSPTLIPSEGSIGGRPRWHLRTRTAEPGLKSFGAPVRKRKRFDGAVDSLS